MPEELVLAITEMSDEALLRALAWLRKNPSEAVAELEAVVSRQAPAVTKKGSSKR